MDVATIRRMAAGPQMDALIAEKVMGWRHIQDGFGRGPETNPISLVHDPVPPYSTDIAAAMAVVDEMYKREWSVDLRRLVPVAWDVTFNRSVMLGYDPIHNYKAGYAQADQLPLAIGRAALQAILAEQP